MPMSVMPKVLMSRVMPEMVDVGATFRSSITVYVTTPRTNPLSPPAASPADGCAGSADERSVTFHLAATRWADEAARVRHVVTARGDPNWH